VRVAVTKIGGVASAEVSLNRGSVVIRLEPGNRVTLEQVREAIRESGFTPRDAEVRARGTVVAENGQLGLALPGIGVAFRLGADPRAPDIVGELQQLRSRDVTVEGRVPETARGARQPPVLQAHSAR
jgi:copper chaperone CopZ